MRTQQFFITGFLCLVFSITTAFAQHLDKRISLKVKDATLPQVLQKVQQKYGFRFSYLNNELPATTKFSAEISEKTLAEVLDVLLDKTDLGYKETNGQIIIKKGFPKHKPKPATFKKLSPTYTEPKPKPTVKTTPDADKSTNNTKAPATGKKQIAATETKPEAAPENLPVVEKENTIPADENINAVHRGLQEEKKPSLLDKLKEIRLRREQQAYNSDSLLINDYHFGVIYPISTNGTAANQYVNRFSAHLLAGTAAGLEGFEFAGLGNVDKSYINGIQLAGVFNVVQNNALGKSLTDSIFDDNCVNGAQIAGVLNISEGNVNGSQIGGVLNLSKNTHGAQIGGLINKSKTVDGVQIGGFINLAHDIDGVQIAGFMNKADTISGSQIGGFLNKAKYVSGSQFGFMNIADSTAGVTIGLLNFVKKGGYKKAEIYLADDFEANFTYKLGVQKFYSMLALGAETKGQKRWGYGYGFGAEWQLAKWFRVNTDLLSYYVIEDSYENFPGGLFQDYELNLLNKFRLLGTIQIAKHLAVFGGPVYNVFVSQHQDADTGVIGSTLPNKTFYDHTSDNGTNVKMWIGFNAGLRF